MRATSWIRIAVVVLVAAMLAGCGEQDGSGDDSPSGTSASSVATAPQSAPAPSDRERARRALLRLADFPAGWNERKEPVERLRCRAVDPFAGARIVTGTGRLQRDENTGVKETIAVFDSAAASRRAYARINSRTAMACLRRDVRQQMVAEASGPSSAPEVMRAEALGRWGRATRFTAAADGPVGQVSGFIDAVHVRAGRALGALVIVAALEPLPDDVYAQILETFQTRLRSAFE